MSEDESGTSGQGGQESGGSEAGGGGEAGGSSRADWQKDQEARLKAQRERRAKAMAEAKAKEDEQGTEDAEEEKKESAKRDEGPSDWETELSKDMQAGESLEVTDPTRDDLKGLESAQREWMSLTGQAGAAIDKAATWLGESMAAVTSFLAPVPAMLLVFPYYKVPIPIPIPVMYKPESLSWSKKATWSETGSKGDGGDCSGKAHKSAMRNAPEVAFKGGGPEKLDIELFFDTTDTQLDVRLYTKPIQALVYKVPLRNEPPLVMFSWGMILSKLSYIDDIDIEYTMFRADGTPLRAEVNIELTEFYIEFLSNVPMNPTSYSEARKTWVVTEGQTLDWIAYQEYGNPLHWRHIAQVNNLSNPRDLRSGQILKLTPLP